MITTITTKTTQLTKKKCVPCEGGFSPLPEKKVKELLNEVEGWQREGKGIARKFKFKDFRAAQKFLNKVADLAESEGHHPDIYWSYNKIKLVLWTHAADGLTENDFIMAAKIDKK